MKNKKTTKKSITLQAQPLAELGRRIGDLENHLSQQVNNDLLFFHAMLALLGMEAMIDGLFTEDEVRLLLAATSGLTIEPAKLAGIAMRINAALTEHANKENHLLVTTLTHKIAKLSFSMALWLWDTLTVYRANSSRHHDRGYLVTQFGVRQ